MMREPAFQSDGRRAHGARPPLPRSRDVLLEHLRAIGFALRLPLLIAPAFVVLATIVLALRIRSGDAVVNLHAQPSSFPGIVGALLPVAVWAREERFGPSFLWTLPVDRLRHGLVKVAAGWLWLMAGVAIFLLCQLVLALLSGGQILPVETLHLHAAPVSLRVPLDPAALQTIRWAPGPLILAVPFASATATYLLGSAVMLGIRYPFRWIAGGVALLALANLVEDVARRSSDMRWLNHVPDRVLSPLTEDRYGLETLLTLRSWSLDHPAMLTSGEQIQVWSAVPPLADWRIAALLWTGAGLLALLAAASRHRERRRA